MDWLTRARLVASRTSSVCRGLKQAVLFCSLCALVPIIGLAGDSTNGPGASEKTKPCFQCNGTGTMKCPVPSCRYGKADCPAPCIKLDQGVWAKHPELNRPDPNELMQLITVSGHRVYVSSHHQGVQYAWVNGNAEMQTCPVCNGTARVPCTFCKGKGKVTCTICEGKGTVPESWSAFDNPRMQDRPTHYKLKDGKRLVGRKVMQLNTTVVIRTEKGDVKLDTADIIEEQTPSSQK